MQRRCLPDGVKPTRAHKAVPGGFAPDQNTHCFPARCRSWVQRRWNESECRSLCDIYLNYIIIIQFIRPLRDIVSAVDPSPYRRRRIVRVIFREGTFRGQGGWGLLVEAATSRHALRRLRAVISHIDAIAEHTVPAWYPPGMSHRCSPLGKSRTNSIRVGIRSVYQVYVEVRRLACPISGGNNVQPYRVFHIFHSGSCKVAVI